MTESIIATHIETTAGVCGGKPRIAGHRIRVQDVVLWHEALGMSPDEIVSEYPQITLADVYAALAYYHDHRETIQRDIEQDKALAVSMKVSAPSKLLQKLTDRDGGTDSLPPG